MEKDIAEFNSNLVRIKTAQGKQINDYLKIKTIGEGPYSKIKLMQNVKTKEYFAMKKYNLFVMRKKNKLIKRENGIPVYTNAAEEVKNEVAIHRILSHPHIAKLFQILRDQEDDKLYLMMQYCSNGQIASWSSSAQKFKSNPNIKDPKQFKRLFIQLTEAISYLHENNIVHRDIKPQNVLLDKDLNVKLIDFGRAVKLVNSEQRLKGSEGTYHFMAPEMLSQVYPEGYDGKQCDMWSLGVTFYAILFNTLPFYEELLIKLFELIENGKYSFPKNVKKEFTVYVPIIERLLSVDSKKRPTVKELLSLLLKLE